MPVQQYSLSASISCLLVLDSYLATVVWLENDVHGQLTLDRLVTDDCSFFEQQKGANPLKYQNITEWCFSKKKKKKSMFGWWYSLLTTLIVPSILLGTIGCREVGVTAHFRFYGGHLKPQYSTLAPTLGSLLFVKFFTISQQNTS